MDLEHRYYAEPLQAFVQGRLGMDNLTRSDVLDVASAAGLRISKFKRSRILPRVKKVLGILRAYRPTDLLDVGSGRGTFLWPLLDLFPDLSVQCVEASEQRFADLIAVTKGGLDRLTPHLTDVCDLPLTDNSVDSVSFLEVLEHLRDPAAAAREVVRVARRLVVVSVPSKPDDNPEHINFFEPSDLTAMFQTAGARHVSVDHVLNHRVAVVKV